MPYTPTQTPDPPMVTDSACKFQVRTEYNVYRCYTEVEYQTRSADLAAEKAANWKKFTDGPIPLLLVVIAIAWFVAWIFSWGKDNPIQRID